MLRLGKESTLCIEHIVHSWKGCVDNLGTLKYINVCIGIRLSVTHSESTR
jgi:hypothetical protein